MTLNFRRLALGTFLIVVVGGTFDARADVCPSTIETLNQIMAARYGPAWPASALTPASCARAPSLANPDRGLISVRCETGIAGHFAVSIRRKSSSTALGFTQGPDRDELFDFVGCRLDSHVSSTAGKKDWTAERDACVRYLADPGAQSYGRREMNFMDSTVRNWPKLLFGNASDKKAMKADVANRKARYGAIFGDSETGLEIAQDCEEYADLYRNAVAPMAEIRKAPETTVYPEMINTANWKLFEPKEPFRWTISPPGGSASGASSAR